MTRTSTIFLVVILLVHGGWSWIDRPVPAVEEGNIEFARGHYRRALAAYDRALQSGEEREVHYNRGLALYQLARQAKGTEKDILYRSAEAALSHAAASGDARLRSLAVTGLSNLRLAQGHVEAAVRGYREALIADPRNDAARENLELALRMRTESKEPGPGDASTQDDAPPPAPDAPEDPPAQDYEDPKKDATKPQPGTASADAPEAATGDVERKLDALERRSRLLRRALFGRGKSAGGAPW